MVFSYSLKTFQKKNFESWKKSRIKGFNNSLDNKLLKRQTISVKENFYQFLFVQNLFNNADSILISSADLKNKLKNQQIGTLTQNNSELFLKDYPFFQQLSTFSYSNVLRQSLEKVGNKNVVSSKHKLFINYKKPFLSYWVLPFLGLASCFPTLFPRPFLSLPKNNNEIKINTFNEIKKNENNKQYQNKYYISYYKTNFKDETHYLNPLNYHQRLQFFLFSKLSSNIKENSNSLDNIVTTKQSFDLKLLKRKIEPKIESYKFKKSATEFSFDLLNRNLKNRSNFKWFWFDLFLNQTQNSFPNKVYFQENNFISEKNCNTKAYTSFNNFFTNVFNEKNKINKINTNSSNFEKLKKENKIYSFSNKETEKKRVNLMLKSKQDYNLTTKEVQSDLYLIGINSNPLSLNESLVNSNIITNSPYKSFKKASFFMDQVLSTIPSIPRRLLSSHLNNEKRLLNFKKPYIIQTSDLPEQNNANALSTSKFCNDLQKTILLILKNQKSNKINYTEYFPSKQKNKTSNYKLQKARFFIRTNPSIIYNCIFEGLQKELKQIIFEKTIISKQGGLLPSPVDPVSQNLDITYNHIDKYLRFQKCSLNLINFPNNFEMSNLNKSISCKTNSNQSDVFVNPIFIKETFNLKESAKIIFTDDLIKLLKLQEVSFSNIFNNFSILKLRNSIPSGNFFNFSEKDYYVLKTKNNNSNSFSSKEYYKFNEPSFNLNKKQIFKTQEVRNRVDYKTKSIDQKQLIKNNFLTQIINSNSFKTNDNSYLSKYIQLIKINIKSCLSPYKFHLTYLPELDINNLYNKNSSKYKVNSAKNRQLIKEQTIKQQYSSNFEKIFLSYLSKSKKTWDSNNKFLILKKNKLCSSFLVLPKNKLISFKNLKKRTRIKLKKFSSDSKFSNYFFVKTKKYLGSNTLNHKARTALISREKNVFRSPLMILKNRLFINKELNQLNLLQSDSLNQINKKRANFSDIWVNDSEKPGVLQKRIKKQNLKLKRRLKKMKCETRRRKKRKIFYPRPIWIKFAMYKKFLDSRYSKKSKTNFQQIGPNTLRTRFNSSVTVLNQSPDSVLQRFNSVDKKSPYYSYWLNNRHNYYLNSGEAIFKNTKDFYRISQTVFGDLKRVLMKSNWLRSYLNPYLDKVKIIYKEMQQSSKNMQFYRNLRTFILSMYGAFKDSVFATKSEDFKLLDSLKPSIYLNMKNSFWERDFSKALPYNFENLIDKNKTLFKKPSNNKLRNLDFATPSVITDTAAALKDIKPKGNNLEINTKQQNAINQLEYNRLIYQRIQRVILNIRENLNLNGQIKNRSKKLGKNIRALIKRDYTKRDSNNGTSPNQKGLNWSKIIKNNIQKLLTYFNYGYDLSLPYSAQILSRNNFYWTLHKSATLKSLNGYSSRKNVWEINKIRETSKNNKTKKILFNIFTKSNILSKPTNCLNPYSGILDTLRNEKLINSQDGMAIEKPFFNNINQDFVESKISFTLPAKMYSMKSEQKLVTIENKLKLLGLYSKSAEKHYKNDYFRFLKQQLLTEKSFYKNYNSNSVNLSEKIKEILINKNKTYFYNRNNSSKISNNYSYWWSYSKTEPTFYLHNSNRTEPWFGFTEIKSENQVIKTSKRAENSTNDINMLTPATLSSFLFHFCTLISFISLGGIRTLIKFYYILISKFSKLIATIQNIRLLPKNKSKQFDFSNTIDFKIYKQDFSKKKLVKNVILKKQKNLNTELIKGSLFSIAIGHSRPYNYFKKVITKPESNSFATQSKVLKDNLINTGWIIIKNKNSRFIITNDLNNKKAIKNEGYNLILKDLNISFLKQINKNNYLISKPEKQKLFNQHSLNKTKVKTMYYSLVKCSNLSSFVYKTGFYCYLLLLKSVDILAIPASFIYKFFEKPGEYVVENLAYSFLVEWSADLISTIPDTVDFNTSTYLNKINNRSILPILFSNLAISGAQSKYQTFNFLLNLGEKNNAIFPVLVSLSHSILKRFLNSSFLMFIEQLCEPDLDYINRQKKGLIFWDIWGDSLKKVAEDNSINIYELTTDKEEQIKLLSKYEENQVSVIKNDRHFFNKIFLENNNIEKFKFNMDSLKVSNLNIGLRSFEPKLFKSNNNYSISNTKNKLFIQSFALQHFDNLLKNKKLNNYLEQSRSKYQNNNSYGWSVSQFLSYQGKDTDLFIDLHPPKTFSASVASLKYSFSVQQPIGSIVCQIFSGIFYKKVSKNILVIGSSGLEKSLLIQAIAGETELKIITDNAHRYAMVYRGVAVGIKLLRDVFEALTVYTPCIFLMEDIHAIGERRPFLIDEASPNASDSTYNKNQSMQGLFLKEKSSASREGLYRSNKHLLNHYKKPYKEVKGLATNHFAFTFLFGDISSKIRKNEIKSGGAGLLMQIIKKENQQNESTLKIENNKLHKKVYSSSLLIKTSTDEFLSPPESSPFNVLILKEASKLKHKKTVKEMPWFGFPGEKYSLVSKYNYSIRIKVALLADLVLSNLSVKLDMITDLLVIIDSVKGNRGFVVFGTTHVPYILDPALRRPGRFDETISLPLIPTLYSRWANYRYNVQYLTTLFKKYSVPLNYIFNKGTTLNLSKYDLINSYKQTYVPRPIENIINYIYVKNSTLSKRANYLNKLNFTSFKNFLKSNKKSLITKDFTWKHLTPLVKDTFKKNNVTRLNSRKVEPYGAKVLNQKLASVLREVTMGSKWNNLRIDYYTDSMNTNFSSSSTLKHKLSLKKYRERKDLFTSTIKNTFNNRFSNKYILKIKSKNYSYACKALIALMLYTNPTLYNISNNSSKTFVNTKTRIGRTPVTEVLKDVGEFSTLKWPNMLKNLSNSTFQDYSIYLSVFGYPFMLKIILMSLIGGKLGENFVISSNLKRNNKNEFGFVNNNSSLFNFDETWKYASSLLFSYIQKRQCSDINKNVAMCSLKLLNFNNKQALMEAPSPPVSNILLPTKRYENYKRTFNNQYTTSQNHFGSSISEQIQLHQQQRLLKRLYKYPIKEFFKSEIINSNSRGSLKNLAASLNTKTRVGLTPVAPELLNDKNISNFTTFNNSYFMLTPLEKGKLTTLNKVSNLNQSYRNVLYNRHKTYLTNQWWNAQQGEHNAETTFLSDIDWRYTFVQSIGDINIDFPDAEQFYNPRNRRWFITQGDWNYWFNIETEQKDIYSHYIYECFTKVYKFLDRNREIIDLYAHFLHQAPLTEDLKERDLLNLYKRFFYGFTQLN